MTRDYKSNVGPNSPNLARRKRKLEETGRGPKTRLCDGRPLTNLSCWFCQATSCCAHLRDRYLCSKCKRRRLNGPGTRSQKS